MKQAFCLPLILAVSFVALHSVTAQVYELRQDLYVPATRYSSARTKTATRIFAIVDAKRADGLVDVYGLKGQRVTVPSYGIGSTTTTEQTFYSIDGHCRHYVHNGSLVLPTPHHESMRLNRDDYNAGACPVSMFFFGEHHSYNSPTPLQHLDPTKMPLTGSTKVPLPYNGTLSQSVSKVPWSQALMEDTRFFAEAAGRRAALAHTSLKLGDVMSSIDNAWRDTPLSRNITYAAEYSKLHSLYKSEDRYYWAQTPSHELYQTYGGAFATRIQGGAYDLTELDWVAEILMISRHQTGTKIFWDVFDHCSDVVAQKKGRGNSVLQQVITASTALAGRVDRDVANNEQIKKDMRALMSMSDSLEEIASKVSQYTQNNMVIPIPSSPGANADCQASSRTLSRFYRGETIGGAGAINKDFATSISPSLQYCQVYDASAYTVEVGTGQYDALTTTYHALGSRITTLTSKLADSTYNPLTWQRFDRLRELLATTDDAFTISTTGIVQLSSFTLGGVADTTIDAPLRLMARIINYMHAWYSTHNNYDIDDLKMVIPQDSTNVINARDLWGNDGRAERCIAELFVSYTGGMVGVANTTLEDVIDDSEIAEHLAAYFSLDQDLLEDYLDTLQQTMIIREFGTNHKLGRLPVMRETNVRLDLFEPEVKTPTIREGDMVILPNMYIEDDDIGRSFRSDMSDNRNTRSSSNATLPTWKVMPLSGFLPDNIRRIYQQADAVLSNADNGLELLRKFALQSNGAAKQAAAIESSGKCSTYVERTNVPSITSTGICATVTEHSVSRGFSPMWKTSSDVLMNDVLGSLRSNHGRFRSSYNDKDIMCYDPIGRAWIVLVDNTDDDDSDDACKIVGPYVGIGLSFGSATTNISSVRVGMTLIRD